VLTVFALIVAVPASTETLPAAEDVLTLEEAVSLALQHNRGVGVAALEVERAEQRVGAARARRLPSIELQALAGTTLNTVRVSYPGGAFGTFPGIGPIPAEDTVVEAPRSLAGNVNATLSQPLTQLHRIGLNTKLSELGRDVERAKLREERAATAAEVRRLYYSLLQTESLLRAKEAQVLVSRELDRVVGQQVAVEVALRSDGLDVKARLATEEYELAGLRGDQATGKERMNDLLGRDLASPFSLVAVSETSIEETDLQLAIARALQRRPDLAQARLAVEQADTDRRLKKAELIPDVSLAVTYVSFVNVDLLPRNVAMAGLQLKWEPLDWGRRSKERAEKALQVEQARSSAKEAEDQARIDVAQRFRKLQEARLLIEAGRLNREAAQEKLRVVTSRHRQEAALLREALDAQSTLSAANAQYDQALSTFWTAKADFQKAVGEEQ
jgi:outer membrane protein TolC